MRTFKKFTEELSELQALQERNDSASKVRQTVLSNMLHRRVREGALEHFCAHGGVRNPENFIDSTLQNYQYELRGKSVWIQFIERTPPGVPTAVLRNYRVPMEELFT